MSKLHFEAGSNSCIGDQQRSSNEFKTNGRTSIKCAEILQIQLQLLQQKQQQLLLLLLLFLLPPLLRFCAYIKYNNNILITTTTTSARGTSLRRSSTLASGSCGAAPNVASTAATSTTAGAAASSRAQRHIAATTAAAAYASPIMGSCFGRCISKESHAATTSCLWRQTTDEQEADLMSNASEKCRREHLIFRIIKFKSKKRPQFIDKFWEQKDLNYSKLTTRNGHDSISDIQLQNLDVHNLLHTAALAKESALNGAAGTQPAAAASSRASSSLDLEWEHEYAHHMRPHYAHRTQTAQALLIDSSSSNNNNNSQQQHNHNNGSYDNHIAQLHDSWQFLSNDEEQLNSLASGSQSLSLPAHVGDTELAAATTSERNERERERRLVRAYAKVPTARNGSLTRTSSSHNSWSHISTPESLEWDQDEEQQRQLRVEDDNLDHETLALLHQIEQLKNRVLNETGDGWFEEGATADLPGGIEFSAAKVTATTATTTTTTSECNATENIS